MRDDVILMQTILWPDEVRRPAFDVLQTDAEVRPQELTMASSLIDSLSSDFDPDEHHDDYREALLAVIDRKLAGGAGVPAETATVPEDEGDAIVVDLMAALRESVQRTSKGDAARAPSTTAAKKTPAKAAAKKAAPRKTAGATKSAAKKASGRRASPTKASSKAASSGTAAKRPAAKTAAAPAKRRSA